MRELTRSIKPTEIDGTISNAEPLMDFVHQISLASTSEIDRLIGDLKDLRDKLQNDANRIVTDITEYASLSQSAAQLTKVVSESVAQAKRGSGAPSSDVAKLAAALDDAWNRIEKTGSRFARPGYARATCEVVAKRIIETARQGVKNPTELADDAVQFFTVNYTDGRVAELTESV